MHHRFTICTLSRAFGKLLIFLPSAFTGGSFWLSRDGSEYCETTQLERESAMSTSALAWFNGVSVTSLPVHSGYRLVLSYDLVQTSPTAVLPGLHVQAEKIEGVRQALLRWKQAKEGDNSDAIPDEIYYFWFDESVLKHIEPFMTELGIVLYRADVEFHRSGSAVKPENWGFERVEAKRKGESGLVWDKRVDEDVDFHKIHSEEYTIQKLTFLDGNPVENSEAFSIHDNNVIPMNFKDDLDEPSEIEYGGGWESNDLDHWFYRDALVFPIYYEDYASETENEDEDGSENGSEEEDGARATVDSVCEDLLKLERPFCTEKEEALVDELMKVCSSGDASDNEVARASALLHRLAMQWKDSKTWVKALSLHPRGAALQGVSVHGFLQAYHLFAPNFFQLAEPFLVVDRVLGQELYALAYNYNDANTMNWCQNAMYFISVAQ
ncbi:hypothetical protein SCHPADRAFT_946136 [Schizopora paradoxa]|uniref:Uncharacterized protein n=1 Tax=Schizopora paradoxa TaxID=27342 RepID=A0A0H2R3J0_9AGAM|nr:hypothetical protein SCHPADRAFT_946136 [Schizopora paradoxa]